MNGNDEQLQFIIKAVDDASAALASVKSATDAIKTSVDGANTSLAKNTTTATSAASANESMAASVFKGVASWDLLKEAAEGVKTFMEGSIEAYLDAQKQLNLVHATVDSMGLSFTAVEPQLKAFGDSMVKLGVDGEDAQQSAAQLAKLSGNDVVKGMQLAKLAADLTASGYGDLASNTNNLSSILVGKGAIALKQYKVEMDANATTADILNAVQGRVTQSAEQYADTVPGKIGVVKQAYVELQQEVGGAFLASLTDAAKGTDGMNTGLDAMKTAGDGVSAAIYEVVQVLALVIEGAEALGTAINGGVAALQALQDAATGDFKGAAAQLDSAAQSNKDSFNALKQTLENMASPMKNVKEAEDELAKSTAAVGPAAAGAGDDIANAQKVAQAAMVTTADRAKQLSGAYYDMYSAAKTDLASLTDDHQKAAASISDSIKKTEADIASLTASYNQQAGSDASGIADQIVASQSKVADLKKQYAAATTDDQKVQLATQLKQEQTNLDSAAGYIAAHQGDIAAAQQRASETDLQRAIDDYNAKRALATEEYNAKLADLNQQLSDEKDQQAAELKLYQQRQVQILQFIVDGTTAYVQASQVRVQQTKDEVDAEVAQYARLASAISSSKSATSGALKTITATNGARANGGGVQRGNSYLVGENGPELFTANDNGNIAANGDFGAGGSPINISITGTFMSEDAARKMSDMIMDQLKRKARISI